MLPSSYAPSDRCSIYGCGNDRGNGVCCTEHRRGFYAEQDALAAAERVFLLAVTPEAEFAAAKGIAKARVALNDLHDQEEKTK